MAEPSTPQPDGPRPPSPRTRAGDRRRDPVALAAWRRVAEQRRRAADPEVPALVEAEGLAGIDFAAATDVEAVPVSGADVVPVVTDDSVSVVVDGAVPVTVHPVPVMTGDPVPVMTGDPVPVMTGDPVPAVTGEAVPVMAGEAVPAAADAAVPTLPDAAVPAVAEGDRAGAAPDDRIGGDPAGATGGTLASATDGDPAGAAHEPVVRDGAGPGGAGGTADPATVRAGSGDGPPPVGRLHDVLLGLAGRLDDDALTTVREMVAAEDDAEAAELLGGCLLAGGVGLTGEERAVLRPWFTAARVDHDLLGLLPADAGALSRSVHRFAPTVGDRAPGMPLARAARRLPGVLAVRESWRVTPAGSAPGPVPHRVVLVETAGPDDCDHVVHHLAHAARSLDDTSVEVFASGAALPVYHREALAAARPLVADESAAGATVGARRPAPRMPERPVLPRFGPVDDDETWRTVADAGTARTIPAPTGTPGPGSDDPEEPGLEDLDDAGPLEAGTDAVPAVPPGAAGQPVRDEPADVVADLPEPETSIDDDLSSTARRIAALWARPAPEDFSAPLAGESLEPTHLEPDDGGTTRRDAVGQEDAPPEVAAQDDAREVDPQPDADDEQPSGRHGRPAATDLGTTSFRSPRPRSRTNGHRVDPAEDETADTGDLGIPSEPAITADEAADDAAAQIQRARHSRARDGNAPSEADPGSARFGHDARYGAGAGPAWPGGPVSGNSGPGPDTLFTSPVDVGEEPVTFGTNGHRHGPDPVGSDDEPVTLGTNGHRHESAAPAPDEEPATGPVAWSGPAGPPQQQAAPPVAGPPTPGPPAAGRPVAGPPAGGPPVPGPPVPGSPASGPAASGPAANGPAANGPAATGPTGNGAAGPGPTGPGPAGHGPGGNGAVPRRPGDHGEDVAPPWAAADGTGWPSETPGWTPAADGGPARAPEPESTASWSPDLDDSVAQLSDRERELLARLHEELAQRERAEGADPFGGQPRPTSDRPAPPQPPSPGNRGPRRPRPGPQPGPPPGGRVNGHGLPGNPDDTGA